MAGSPDVQARFVTTRASSIASKPMPINASALSLELRLCQGERLSQSHRGRTQSAGARISCAYCESADRRSAQCPGNRRRRVGRTDRLTSC